MIEIFVKVIITLVLLYGSGWLLFSGLLVRPFLPPELENDPSEVEENSSSVARETTGVVLTLLTTLGVTAMLIAITWVF